MTVTAHDEVIPFTAGDGRTGNVLHVVRAPAPDGDAPAPTKGPVLLVHGAGVRANIFRAAVPVTIVDALLDDGFDVWLENWRASTSAWRRKPSSVVPGRSLIAAPSATR